MSLHDVNLNKTAFRGGYLNGFGAVFSFSANRLKALRHPPTNTVVRAWREVGHQLDDATSIEAKRIEQKNNRKAR